MPRNKKIRETDRERKRNTRNHRKIEKKGVEMNNTKKESKSEIEKKVKKNMNDREIKIGKAQERMREKVEYIL